MSTILDALRKVERDREVPRDELLDVELPPPRARRGISTRVILACASIGFAAGIGLALWRDTAPLEQTPPAAPAALPVVNVPPPPQARPRHEAKVAAAPETDAAPAKVPTESAVAAEPAVIANAAPAAVPPPAVESGTHDGTALEPSPFAAAQGTGAGAAPAPNALPPSGPVRGHKAPGRPMNRAAVPLAPAPPAAAVPLAPAPPAPAPPPPNAVAALAPPPPVISAPRPQAVPEGAPEAPSAAPPTTVIDTGRSPSGAPRVALTFLQWSADPDRRFAFVSIDGAPSVRVREGDTASGMSVSQIMPTGVQFQREGQSFIIRPRH